MPLTERLLAVGGRIFDKGDRVTEATLRRPLRRRKRLLYPSTELRAGKIKYSANYEGAEKKFGVIFGS